MPGLKGEPGLSVRGPKVCISCLSVCFLCSLSVCEKVDLQGVCNQATEYLLSMHKVLCLIPALQKKRNRAARGYEEKEEEEGEEEWKKGEEEQQEEDLITNMLASFLPP